MSLSPQRPEPAAFNCIPDYYLAIVGQTNCSIFGQKKLAKIDVQMVQNTTRW